MNATQLNISSNGQIMIAGGGGTSSDCRTNTADLKRRNMSTATALRSSMTSPSLYKGGEVNLAATETSFMNENRAKTTTGWITTEEH